MVRSPPPPPAPPPRTSTPWWSRPSAPTGGAASTVSAASSTAAAPKTVGISHPPAVAHRARHTSPPDTISATVLSATATKAASCAETAAKWSLAYLAIAAETFSMFDS